MVVVIIRSMAALLIGLEVVKAATVHTAAGWPSKVGAMAEAESAIRLAINEHIVGKSEEVDGQARVHLHQV